MTKEIYLGDGLYASFDGYSIILRAPRADGDHWVGLEPAVLLELIKFAQSVGMISSQNAEKMCKACGCKIDKDGCGCNPHDA